MKVTLVESIGNHNGTNQLRIRFFFSKIHIDSLCMSVSIYLYNIYIVYNSKCIHNIICIPISPIMLFGV